MTAELPDFLKQAPEVRAEDERGQAALRASHTRAHLTDEERTLARGVQLEQVAISNLAEALAMQGRYRDAGVLHPAEEKQAEYFLIAEAIEKSDELCECPRIEREDPVTRTTLSVSPRRNLKNIYSPKHKQTVALTYCDTCGTYNARPATGQMTEIGSGKKEGLRDTQVLK